MASKQATIVFAGAGPGEAGNAGKFRPGLYRREIGGGDWQSVTAGLPANVEVRTIAVHPRDANVIFAGTQDGPYRSTNGGRTWERLDFPDRNVVIWTMSVHPTNPRIIYAGAAPVAVYRSEDGGDHWQRLPAAKSPAHCERSGFDTGGGDNMAALLGGQVHMNIIQYQPSVIELIRNGRLRALAVTTDGKRSKSLPDVQSMKEAGIDGMDVYTWAGVVGPARMPKAIVDRLHAEIAASLKEPAIRDRFSAQDAEMVGSEPRVFAGLIRREIERWSEVIRTANIPRQ